MLPFNFNEIVVEDGKQYLHDTRAERTRCDKAKRVADAYEDIRRMLTANEYPATREWIEAIANKGEEGLEEMVVGETERRIKADAVPPFLAGVWRRSCTGEVPPEMWEGARAARRVIADEGDGLPLQSSDLVFREDEILALGEVCARIRSGCRIEITDKMKAEAAEVVRLAGLVRALSVENGVNAVELVSRYARAGEMPSPLSPSVLNDIVFRRHAPGKAEEGDMSEIMNLVGRQSIPMKPLTT